VSSIWRVRDAEVGLSWVLAPVAVGRSAGCQCSESGCGALPHVGAEQLARLVGSAEAEVGDLVVGDAQVLNRRRREDSAVEDEHERVVPGAVGRNPFDAQEVADLDAQAEFFADFALCGVDWRFVGLRSPRLATEEDS
jgi:hypothetical protein